MSLSFVRKRAVPRRARPRRAAIVLPNRIARKWVEQRARSAVSKLRSLVDRLCGAKTVVNPVTGATMSVVAALGAGLGTWAGYDTVSEIDPVHFRAAASPAPMRAPITADRAIAVEPAAYASGFGRGCIKCRTYPEEYHPAPATEMEALWDEPVLAVPLPSPSEPAVDRSGPLAPYAYYPIEAGDVAMIEPPAPVD